MAHTMKPKYDTRERDTDSGKLGCLVNNCDAASDHLPNPVILAVEVLRGVSIPPGEEPWPTLYHQAIARARQLCCGIELLALRGDFILHIRKLRGSRKADENYFYVGLPESFEGDIGLHRTRLVDGFRAQILPEALKIHAVQHVLKCSVCQEWMDIMIWAEDEGLMGEFAWRLIRAKAKYVIENEDTDVMEDEYGDMPEHVDEAMDEDYGTNEDDKKSEHEDISEVE